MAKEYDARMHTAEHVLNATMVALLGSGRSFSSHINPGKSKCDYRFPRDITEAEATELTARINAALGANLPVTEEAMPRDEAATRFNLTRLPADAGDTLRIIHVGDYDACPCIGTHVPNTSEVGRFVLVSHSWADDVLRLRFKLEAAH